MLFRNFVTSLHLCPILLFFFLLLSTSLFSSTLYSSLLYPVLRLISNVTFANPRCCSMSCPHHPHSHKLHTLPASSKIRSQNFSIFESGSYCNSLTLRLLLRAHALFPASPNVFRLVELLIKIIKVFLILFFSKIANVIHNMCDDNPSARGLFSSPQACTFLKLGQSSCIVIHPH